MSLSCFLQSSCAYITQDYLQPSDKKGGRNRSNGLIRPGNRFSMPAAVMKR